MTGNSVGTPESTAAGARIVPQTIRKTWTHSRGTSATARGSADNRGITYQTAMSAYAMRLKVNWVPKRTIGSMNDPPVGNSLAWRESACRYLLCGFLLVRGGRAVPTTPDSVLRQVRGPSFRTRLRARRATDAGAGEG